MFGLGVALIGASLGALFIGPSTLAPEDVLAALYLVSSDHLATTIVYDIRLPRILLAVLVGGGVAVAGAGVQGLFRNPLADPALIGVSSGAALFGSAYIALGLEAAPMASIGLSGAAFLGGLVATLIVVSIGRRAGTLSSMLLAGIAINAIAIAGVGLFSYLSSDVALRSVAFWALGSFSAADWEAVGMALVIPLAVVAMMFDRHRLNALTLGDAEAGHLGVSVPALRLRIVILTAVVVGVGVSVAGIIAFVGLVVPHLLRLSVGSSHTLVLPGSALLGATLLVIADTASRIIVTPAELPVGILTALIGGPFFIYLILKHKGKLGL